ncbi:PucR family transcriptional regulator [Rubneribacter sp.]|nr:helix-turn-helix domain-containing protein [Candidatus Rubneribacter avistercoris]
MKFNLDLACAELADLDPVKRFEHDSALSLDRVEEHGPKSRPRATSLFVIGAGAFAALDAKAWEGGGSFLVTGSEGEPDGRGLPAAFLPARACPPDERELVERLLEWRMRLDAWSESVLEAMARDAPLQEVFDAAAAMFSNPLMLSDSALYYVLTAGRLPAGFRDPFWTPAIETGVCPTEVYFDTWMRSSKNAFRCERAYLVPGGEASERTYLVRNLIADGQYHGCFELVDVNAPLGPADLALADYVGDLLALILPRRAYPQIANSAMGPLQELVAGNAVRPRVLEYGLAEMGWAPRDAHYVVRFSEASASSGQGPHLQAERRIAETYPLARFVEDGDAHLMIARDADYPLARFRDNLRPADAQCGEPRFLAGFSSLSDDFSRLRATADQAAFAYDRIDPEVSDRFLTTAMRFYDDCWLEDVRRRLSADADLSWLLDPAATALAEADARDGTEHVATALAYLEHGCNATRTAEALFVHRNTLSYRLKRIKAVCGVDLESLRPKRTDLLRLLLSLRLLA